jgi:hypothetical protein
VALGLLRPSSVSPFGLPVDANGPAGGCVSAGQFISAAAPQTLLELIDKDQRGIPAVMLASTQNCLNWPVGLRVTVKFKACPAD